MEKKRKEKLGTTIVYLLLTGDLSEDLKRTELPGPFCY